MNSWSHMLMSFVCPIAANACTWGRCLGRRSMSICRRAIPIAPEEQITTLWPSLLRVIAVSTIVERVDSNGSCVFSSTIEDVPSLITTVRCFFIFTVSPGSRNYVVLRLFLSACKTMSSLYPRPSMFYAVQTRPTSMSCQLRIPVRVIR